MGWNRGYQVNGLVELEKTLKVDFTVNFRFTSASREANILKNISKTNYRKLTESELERLRDNKVKKIVAKNCLGNLLFIIGNRLYYIKNYNEFLELGVY